MTARRFIGFIKCARFRAVCLAAFVFIKTLMCRLMYIANSPHSQIFSSKIAHENRLNFNHSKQGDGS